MLRIILKKSVARWPQVQYYIIHYSTVQHSALQCSTVQCRTGCTVQYCNAPACGMLEKRLLWCTGFQAVLLFLLFGACSYFSCFVPAVPTLWSMLLLFLLFPCSSHLFLPFGQKHLQNFQTCIQRSKTFVSPFWWTGLTIEEKCAALCGRRGRVYPAVWENRQLTNLQTVWHAHQTTLTNLQKSYFSPALLPESPTILL